MIVFDFPDYLVPIRCLKQSIAKSVVEQLSKRSSRTSTIVCYRTTN